MKKILLSLVCILAVLPMQAKQIGKDAALRNAVAFTRSSSMTKASKSDAKDMQLVYTEGSTKADNFYVYNNAKGGFVIVSADDCVTPILGYSDSGNFNPNNIPDGLKYMLNHYKKVIDSAMAETEGETADSTEVIAPQRSEISPLVTTHWDQGEPYNNLCPMYSVSQRCVTGCTATAMAQIINYHKHPVTGKGSKTYSPTINGTKKSITVNFATTTYDWDNMKDSYDSGYTTEEANAVATLMYHCGVGVSMQYGLSSGAAVIDAAYALVNYFDFAPSLMHTQRALYTNAEWEDLVYNELANNRPVLYAGYNEDAGHAFVCDGYSKDGFFHINWGWSGSSDGYFKLTLLEPGSQGYGGSAYGYSMNQEILYNITPTDGDAQGRLVVSTDGGVTPSASSVTANYSTTKAVFKTGFLTTFSFFDVSRKTISRGVLVENKSNNEQTYIFDDIDVYALTLGTYQLGDVKVYASSLADLGDGEYRVYPAYMDVDADYKAKYRLKAGESQYVNMTVSGKELTFEAQEVTAPDINVTISDLPEKVYPGSKCNFKAAIVNRGGEFMGEIFPALIDSTYTVVARATYTTYFIPQDGTVNDNVSMPLPSNVALGEYSLGYVSKAGVLISDLYPIEVVERPAEGVAQSVSVKIKDAKNVNCQQMEVDVTLTAANGMLDGCFAAAIVPEGGNTVMTMIESDDMIIESGESKTIKITGGFSGNAGESYGLYIFYYSNYTNQWRQISYGYSFTVAEISGIENVKDGVSLNVYPNPATDIVNIVSASPINAVSVISMDGKIVGNVAVGGNTETIINVSDYTDGIYFVKVVGENGVETVRLIKK